MRILLIDDDGLITMALSTILSAQPDMEVCAVGSDGSEAAPLYDEHRPDVVLMDIRMKEMNGIDAAEQILAKDPGACILLLTTFMDDEYIIRAIRAGARGYLLKSDYGSLADSIRAAHAGQSVFGSEITGKMTTLITDKSDAYADGLGLTEKEFQLSGLIAEGLSNKEIAERMYLGEGTVRNYLSTVLEKLELRDRTQLAIFYLTGKKPGSN